MDGNLVTVVNSLPPPRCILLIINHFSLTINKAVFSSNAINEMMSHDE